MENATQNDVWRGIMNKWLMSATFAPVKILGARQVKVMTRGMGLYLVNTLLKEFAPSAKETVSESGNDEVALEEFRKVEVSSGVVSDPENVEIEQAEDGGSKLTFKKCPYGSACNTIIPDLLGTGEFNKSMVPCFRCDTYSAATALLNHSRRQYRLIQFAPGVRCSGEILKPRTSRTRER